MHGIRQLTPPGAVLAAWIAAVALPLSVVAPQPACAAAGGDAAGEGGDGFEIVSCLDATAPAKAPLLAHKVTIELEAVPMLEAVDRLRSELGIPVSFIEAGQDAEITGRVEDAPMTDLVALLLAGSPPLYRCAVVDGRVVIFPDQERYLGVVSGVSIRDQYRAVAARRYLDGLDVEGLRGIGFLAAGVLEGEALAETVSLDPEAPFLEHLVQLLGRDDRGYFVLRDAPGGGRYLTLGRVP